MPDDSIIIIELSKRCYQSLEELIDPVKRFVYMDYPQSNFMSLDRKFLFTYHNLKVLNKTRNVTP